MEVASGELVERVDILAITPVDEEAEPRAMGVNRRLLAVAGLIVEVEFEGSLRSGRFEGLGRLFEQLLETILEAVRLSDGGNLVGHGCSNPSSISSTNPSGDSSDVVVVA